MAIPGLGYALLFEIMDAVWIFGESVTAVGKRLDHLKPSDLVDRK
jgi:hypothetical protein